MLEKIQDGISCQAVLRKKWQILSVFFILISFMVSCGSGSDTIRIVQLNSLKGRIFPVFGRGKVAQQKKGTPSKRVRVSGFSLISTLLKNLTKESGVAPFLIANSNFLYGSSEAYFSEGRKVIEFMSRVGFQVLVVGHREFNFGPTILRNLALEARKLKKRIDFLSCNILDKKTGKTPSYLKPYVILENSLGHRIGVIGIASRAAIAKIPTSLFKTYKYIDPYKVVVSIVKKMRKQKVDKIVVVGDFNIKVAKGNPKKIEGDNNKRTYAIKSDLRKLLTCDVDLFMIRSKKPIQGLARFNVKVDKKKRVKKVLASAVIEGGNMAGLFSVSKSGTEYEYKQFMINSTVLKPDLSLAEDLYNLHEALNVISGKAVGIARVDLPHHFRRESALGNFVTDVLRNYCRTQVVLLNSGSMKRGFKKGAITKQDLYEILPYQTLMVRLTMKGYYLRKVLENAVANLGENSKSFSQVSGVKFRFDSRKKAGARILNGSILINNMPLNLAATYTVAVPGFMADGGDRYYTLRDGIKRGLIVIERLRYDQLNRNVVEGEIAALYRRNKDVVKNVEGRVVDVSGR